MSDDQAISSDGTEGEEGWVYPEDGQTSTWAGIVDPRRFEILPGSGNFQIRRAPPCQ